LDITYFILSAIDRVIYILYITEELSVCVCLCACMCPK